MKTVAAKISLTSILLFCALHAEEEIEQVKLGNLAVRERGRPGPMFSIGQNVLDKGDFVFYNVAYYNQRVPSSFFSWENLIGYGLTKSISVLLTPSVIRNSAVINGDKITSKGFTDLPIQIEWYYLVKKKPTWTFHSTLIGSLFLPTGSVCKAIPTGLGAPSFWLGAVLARLTSIDWYFFTDVLTGLAMRNKQHVKPGTAFFYESALSYNLKYVKNWAILAGIECNGFFVRPDKLFDAAIPNTGGNVIFLGPTFYASSDYVKVQAGFQYCIAQHLRGVQDKRKWRVGLNLGFMW